MVIKRPASYDEGIAQIRKAVAETVPPTDGDTPRAKLWRACERLVTDRAFVDDGLRVLYDANQLVSFLFHTIVPHIEERLRYTKLQDDMDRATRKPEHVQQNEERFVAIIQATARACVQSERRAVDDAYARMRAGIRLMFSDAEVVVGLRILYVSSKVARKSLDLIYTRLIDTFENDSNVVRTTAIPWDAMLLKTMSS
jgi:hypothetical protein